MTKNIVIAVLAVVLVAAIGVCVYLGIALSDARSENASLQSEYASLQSEYASLESEYESHQVTVADVAAKADLYLAVARLRWQDSAESPYWMTDWEYKRHRDQVLRATNDGRLIDAADTWWHSGPESEEWDNWQYTRALIEGLAETLDDIGCEDWTWVTE